MAGTTNNLHKSDSQWLRFGRLSSRRAFSSKTQAAKHSGREAAKFANSRVAAIAENGENES